MKPTVCADKTMDLIRQLRAKLPPLRTKAVQTMAIIGVQSPPDTLLVCVRRPDNDTGCLGCGQGIAIEVVHKTTLIGRIEEDSEDEITVRFKVCTECSQTLNANRPCA